MLVSATVGLAALRSKPVAGPPAPGRTSHGFTVFEGGRRARTRGRRSHGTFMERMEQRWQRRRGDAAGW
jgi:hypothetical protein